MHYVYRCICIYITVLFIHIKEGNLVICNDIDEL